MAAPNLPEGFSLDYGDPDLLVLYGPDGLPVAVFSAEGAANEEIEKEARAEVERRELAADHPQRVIQDALDEAPPISEETRERFRRRLARALLRDLNLVIQTITEAAFGRPGRGDE